MPASLEIPGFNAVQHFQSVTSTMDCARQMLQRANVTSAEWSGLVTADHQTAGRGRQGRTWLGAQQAFMGTFLFCTDRPIAALSGYSLSVGHAVVSALDIFGLAVSLKWPNDLVVVQRGAIKKLGGILIEVEEVAELRCVLVGLGINVSQPPEEVSDIATSLETLGVFGVSTRELTELLARALLAAHRGFVGTQGLRATLDAWQERSCFVKNGTELTIAVGDSMITGVYRGLSDAGGLLLAVDGQERTIHSGHILQIRL